MIRFIRIMDNYQMWQCEKGHQLKVFHKDGIVPKECIICLHNEKLKKEGSTIL